MERNEFLSALVCICVSLSLSLLLQGIILILILERVTPRLRKTNQLVKGSRCRGGIVHIRVGCSRALLERPNSSKALWRFRASTSNSPSGQNMLHFYTHMC
jgi:hypothetical protein